ncbi:MAG: cation:dicarboxylase symporter family transporter [Holosporaceae bacterium]
MFITSYLRHFKSLPFQLIATIALGVLIHSVAPPIVLDSLFTAGAVFKDLLMMFIPFVVAGYLMSSLTSFDRKSLILVLAVALLAVVAGFVTVFLAYGIAQIAFPFMKLSPIATGCALEGPQCVKQLWALPFKSPLTPSVAIVCALVLGFAAVLADIKPLKNFAETLRVSSTYVLKRYFIPLLPLYVLAVVLKIQSEGTLVLLLKDYGKVFGLMHASLFTLFVVLLAISTRFSFKSFKENIKALISPAITAFSTMSGVATMPILVDSISERLKSKTYPGFVIPLTTNIHTFGDGFVVTLNALALLTMATGVIPPLDVFIGYALYYCLARFFNACVPGGGALIMAPFVQTSLGLPTEFLGLFMTLYMLQDPLITMWNTLGNGLFALATHPWFASFFKKKVKPSTKAAA